MAPNITTEYGLDPERSTLIRDIIDTWGVDLSDISAGDGLWMIENIARRMRTFENFPISDAGEEAARRLTELTMYDLEGLLQAIANC